MPFNEHYHIWGKNEHGSFCLTCGQFQESKEPEHGGFNPEPKPNVIWPTGKSKKDFCCE